MQLAHRRMNQLINKIRKSYVDFIYMNYRNKDEAESDIAKFYDGLLYNEDSQYFKILTGVNENSKGKVWGFVVKQNDGKLKEGDILMPRDFCTPHRNTTYGNIFEYEYKVDWNRSSSSYVETVLETT